MKNVHRLGLSLLPVVAASCVSSIPMRSAVIAYDETAARVGSEQLLLNIARVQHHRSIHFTKISSVSATYRLEMSLGMTPPLGGTSSTQGLLPIFGGSAEENPTITLIPVEGEEYNERILSSMTETHFGMMLREGADLDMLLRMIGAEYRVDDRTGNDRILRNRPSRKAEYEEYRQRVLQLASLYNRNELYVDTLVIDQVVQVEAFSADHAATVLEALENGYRWNPTDTGGELSRKLPGRVVMTNYDLDQLSREERRSLYREAAALESNAVLVDVRADGPGGEFPMHGTFRLRGFLGILNYLGRGLEDEPEYAVVPDPRTTGAPFDPPATLMIEVTDSVSEGALVSTEYEGKVYAIVGDASPEERWNQESFRLLGQLFELSVHPAEFSNSAPTITIAK